MTPIDDDSRERLLGDVRDAMERAGADPARLATVRAGLAGSAIRGGTTLREVERRPRWIAAGGLLGVGAAALVAVLVLPAVDRKTTVSAAEILGRSRAALATPSAGIEVLSYDLTVGGLLADLLPVEQTGRLTVEETIDHDRVGRYRLLKLAPGGEIVGGIADDPVHGIRTRYLRANDRGYLLRFRDADVSAFSVPAVKRMALQAFIALMQTEDHQAVRETACGAEACYEVTVPRETAAPGALVSLSHARVLITAADARVVEASAVGEIAGRSFTVEFSLRQRDLRAASSVRDEDFEIASRPGDIVLEGSASSNPVWDVVERALAAIPPQPAR